MYLNISPSLLHSLVYSSESISLIKSIELKRYSDMSLSDSISFILDSNSFILKSISLLNLLTVLTLYNKFNSDFYLSIFFLSFSIFSIV